MEPAAVVMGVRVICYGALKAEVGCRHLRSWHEMR